MKVGSRAMIRLPPRPRQTTSAHLSPAIRCHVQRAPGAVRPLRGELGLRYQPSDVENDPDGRPPREYTLHTLRRFKRPLEDAPEPVTRSSKSTTPLPSWPQDLSGVRSP